MVSMLFRGPQARSSALTALGTSQPWAFGSLNREETLDSASNYYLGSLQQLSYYVMTMIISEKMRTGCDDD